MVIRTDRNVDIAVAILLIFTVSEVVIIVVVNLGVERFLLGSDGKDMLDDPLDCCVFVILILYWDQTVKLS